MRRLTAIAMVLAFVLTYSSPVFSLPEPITKVKDSVVDIVKSPLELGHHVMEETKTAEFKPFGLMGGILKGSFYSVKKMGTGVVDIVTLPLDYLPK